MMHQSRGCRFCWRSVVNREHDHNCRPATSTFSKKGFSVGSPIVESCRAASSIGEREISPPWGPGAWAGHRYPLRSSREVRQVETPQRKRNCLLRCCQSLPRRWPAGRWPTCPRTGRSLARPSQTALSLHKCIPFCRTSAILWAKTLRDSSPSGPGLQGCMFMHNAIL